MRSCDGVAEKHEIHHTEHTTRIGWEKVLEPLLNSPSTPSTPSPSAQWWRGSSSPLDYWIVEVTCIKLSLVLWWLESHELSIMTVTIFVLPLWWIFCLWEYLWDAKIFLSLTYEYIYIYIHWDYSVIDDRIIFCTYSILLMTHVCTSYDTCLYCFVW
jgi:hypothetical protein